nr:MAG TPA: hypothetical protein [Caudoviricetes sp.]
MNEKKSCYYLLKSSFIPLSLHHCTTLMLYLFNSLLL